MIVRELLESQDAVKIIARAVFEDKFPRGEWEKWIDKYYSLLHKLTNTKVRKSDMMICFSVCPSSEKRFYGDVSGFTYRDIKNEVVDSYTLEDLNCLKYASLYVPNYSIQVYGAEVIASEILREYGWNDYDKSIKCSEELKRQIIVDAANMTSGLFLADKTYLMRCRQEFCAHYEGRKLPEWRKD